MTWEFMVGSGDGAWISISTYCNDRPMNVSPYLHTHMYMRLSILPGPASTLLPRDRLSLGLGEPTEQLRKKTCGRFARWHLALGPQNQARTVRRAGSAMPGLFISLSHRLHRPGQRRRPLYKSAHTVHDRPQSRVTIRRCGSYCRRGCRPSHSATADQRLITTTTPSPAVITQSRHAEIDRFMGVHCRCTQHRRPPVYCKHCPPPCRTTPAL